MEGTCKGSDLRGRKQIGDSGGGVMLEALKRVTKSFH